MEVGNRNWRLGNGARKILFYGVLPGVMIVSLTVSIGATYAQSYNNKIFPGVLIGPIDVGGLTHEEAAAKLATATNAAIKDGLTVTIDGLTQTIPLLNEGVSDPDTSVELVNWKMTRRSKPPWLLADKILWRALSSPSSSASIIEQWAGPEH